MKINPNPTFTSEVNLTVPGQEAMATITVTWRHKGRNELKEWSARPLLATVQGVVPLDVEAAYIGEVIADWKGPVDDKGVPVPYTLAALEQLMQGHPVAGQELYQQYLRAATESKLKN